MCRELSATSSEALRDRLLAIEGQIRDDGVTYNVYADPRGADRPWDVDLLPLILPHEEWAAIETAIIQRATLLDCILADVYGPQRLLREGILPPAVVYGHSGFLRPCVSAEAEPTTRLRVYAVDLTRSPDGRWWVVADRTQVPSGAGYALENRLAISRAFPDLFRDLGVERLAGYFAAFRDGLMRAAPPDHEPPLIALLTPGPYNETYFEHAYLARYLGISLVEGSDLTVRDGCVWLKTLSGLVRVHVILRRLDDDYCDSLELRSDSSLGVPGLTEAARRGNVLLANSLGSGLLESGVLLGFLPGLCERLLGEPLAMPSVATWWCGEDPALDDVIERLDRLVIKPAFPQLRFEAVFGEDLTDVGRAALVAEMRAQPQNYVAQELVRLSHAPVWDRSGPPRLVERAVGLRVFACAGPHGYVVMPGGLTRVASGPDARVISMQRGGGSKDTWVLADRPVGSLSLLQTSTSPRELVRSGGNLSSRVAENLYWFGRYAERSDSTARLLRVALQHALDGTPADGSSEWVSLIELCRRAGLLAVSDPPPHALVRKNGAAKRPLGIEKRLLAAMSAEGGDGLVANLRELLRVAAQLRERLSIDNWRTLNAEVHLLVSRRRGRLSVSDALASLDRTVVATMTLAGFALDGMTRDVGWRLLSIGRRLERLQFLCAALEEALDGPPQGGLDWLLELADSTITYRSRYRSRPEWLPVLDLLVCDESNPRSVAFQLHGLRSYLARLAESFGPCGEELLLPAIAGLEAIDPGPDLAPGSAPLARWLRGTRLASYALSDRVSSRFFSHAGEVNRATAAS
jgi:uncharacterized circularly permuted ATP-grasp superfamily protein/uncharacterized alpha-E superfamily protein